MYLLFHNKFIDKFESAIYYFLIFFVLPYILCYFISYHIIFSSGYLFHIIQFEYRNLLSWIFSREQIHTYDLICEHQLLHRHQIRYILI